MTSAARYDPFSLEFMAPSLKFLFGLSIAVFAAQVLGNFFPALDFDLVSRFGLIPALVARRSSPQLWRLVTYLFLHGGFLHLAFNLIGLQMFGAPVVVQWGDREFLKFFFLCGIGAGAAQLALSPGSMVPVIGLSGAVYGLLVAVAMLYPNAVVYVYFLRPMKMAHMAILFGVIEFFLGARNSTPTVARFAHLGGMATGYVYMSWGVWKLRLRALVAGPRAGGNGA